MRQAVQVFDYGKLLAASQHAVSHVALSLSGSRWWYWPTRRLRWIFEELEKKKVIERHLTLDPEKRELVLSYKSKHGPRGWFLLRTDCNVIGEPRFNSDGSVDVVVRTWKPDKHGKRKEGQPVLKEAVFVDMVR